MATDGSSLRVGWRDGGKRARSKHGLRPKAAQMGDINLPRRRITRRRPGGRVLTCTLDGLGAVAWMADEVADGRSGVSLREEAWCNGKWAPRSFACMGNWREA